MTHTVQVERLVRLQDTTVKEEHMVRLVSELSKTGM